MRITPPDPKHDLICSLQNKADKLSRSESMQDCRQAIEMYTNILSMLTYGSNLWIERTSYIFGRARAFRRIGDYKAALADLRECVNIDRSAGYNYTAGIAQKHIDEIINEMKEATAQRTLLPADACAESDGREAQSQNPGTARSDTIVGGKPKTIGLLARLFRRSHKHEGQCESLGKSRSPYHREVRSIEHLLRKRLSLLESECARHPGLQSMKPRWARLLAPDVLAFSACAINTGLQKSMENHTHQCEVRRFDGLSVCVSTIPTIDPVRARALFRHGYMAFINVMMHELGFNKGEIDFAHWIYMADGNEWNLDITFMPSRNMVRTQGPNSITTVSSNLLSDVEKRTVLGR
jgi:hypothetical protein